MVCAAAADLHSLLLGADTSYIVDRRVSSRKHHLPHG